MVIELSKPASINLSEQIIRKFFRYDSFAELNGVSKTVLSRQLSSGKIEYSFLVKYLVALEMLPKDYSPYINFHELFFISTLPEKYRDDIYNLFTRDFR